MTRSDYTVPTFVDVANPAAPPNGAVPLDAAHINAMAQAIGNSARQTGALDARDYGVTANGSTNDRAALASAVAAAATGSLTLVLPAGTIVNSGAAIELPSGVRVRGQGKAATLWNGPGFIFNDNNEVAGIGFNGATAGSAAAVASKTDVQHYDGIVRECHFKNYGTYAIELAPSADNAAATRFAVLNNSFVNNGIAVLGERPFDCRIEGNTSVNAAATGYHFSFYGGHGNRIAGNTTSGGITGIAFIYNRSAAGQIGKVYGNVITGNRIVTPSEEGISLDCRANEAANTAVVDYGTVVSTSFNGGVPQLTVNLDAAFAAGGSKLYAFDAIFMSGALAGQAFTNIGESNAAIFINGFDPNQSTAVVAGDAVAIGMALSNNVIASNTVELAGTFGIALWGLCVGNTVANNTIRGTRSGSNVTGTLTVMSLNGVVASTAGVTGRLTKAPSTGNSVVGNTLFDTDLVFALTDYGGGGAYTTLRNRAVGNVISNGTLTSVGHTLLTN